MKLSDALERLRRAGLRSQVEEDEDRSGSPRGTLDPDPRQQLHNGMVESFDRRHAAYEEDWIVLPLTFACQVCRGYCSPHPGTICYWCRGWFDYAPE